MRNLHEPQGGSIGIRELHKSAGRMIGHNRALSAFTPAGPIVSEFDYRMLKQSASFEYRQIRVSA